VGDESGAAYIDFVEDPNCELPDKKVCEENLEDSVELMLCDLNPKEAKVLRLYYGLEGNEAMTLAEVGAVMGLSGGRTQQIKENAFEKIRKLKAFKYMRAYKDMAV